MGAYVHIVESPSPGDLADGRTEGSSLRETFRLSGTANEYRLAVNGEEFRRVFDLQDVSNPLVQRLSAGEAPILHLSMHGNHEGIALTDGTMIDWAELRHILTPLNDFLPMGLMVAFSTCGGAASIRMSMRVGDDEKAFYATVGSFDDVHWSDALVAFTSFYHNLFRHDLSVADAVERMKAASGDSNFVVFNGHEQKTDFIRRLAERRSGLGFGLMPRPQASDQIPSDTDSPFDAPVGSR